MRIEETVEVARSVEQVWALFSDVPELARCLPGAELTEDKGGGVYAGSVAAKLGPMTARFEGEATVTSDEATRTGTVKGRGMDRSGGSVGQVAMEYTLSPGGGGGTTIHVEADVLLSGAAAQFGRTGLVKEMSSRLIGDFVRCVEAKLAAATPEEAAAVEAEKVRGLGLFLSSLLASIGKLFRKLFRRD